MKILSRLVMTVLVLVLAAFGFLHFSPDYNLYMVRSESMKPTINMGDLIITGPLNGPVNGELKPGTIITYEYRNDLVTHRVYSINGETLVTKGDSVEGPDPWSVALSDVRGMFLFKIPSVGYLTHFIRTKQGWFLSIIVPGTFLVLWLAKDIVQEALSDA
ncbi:signal peptidase I [Chloroflexota bacterium]